MKQFRGCVEDVGMVLAVYGVAFAAGWLLLKGAPL